MTFTVPATGLVRERIADVWFYPMRWGAIEHAAAQTVDIHTRGVSVQARRGVLPVAIGESIDGVLVITERLDNGVARRPSSSRPCPPGHPRVCRGS